MNIPISVLKRSLGHMENTLTESDANEHRVPILLLQDLLESSIGNDAKILSDQEYCELTFKRKSKNHEWCLVYIDSKRF